MRGGGLGYARRLHGKLKDSTMKTQDSHSGVTVDGSQGEGGGQILRTSLSLSALTGRPVEITRIRAGRSRPGLQPQHLASVRAAAGLCAAALEGAEIGSGRLRFAPQAPPAPGAYHFAIGTAGATALVMQTVLLPLALAPGPSRVTVTGGTHVSHAPTADYLERVYLPTLARHGLAASCASPRAGFFPKGGGVVQAEIAGGSLPQPVTLTGRGSLHSLTALVVTSGLPPSVAERGIAAVRQGLGRSAVNLSVEAREAPSVGPGAAVFVVADCEGGWAGFSALGERGKRMEDVAEDACRAFREWWETGAACEEHLADQLVLPMALTPGESRWTTSRVTDHLRTVLQIVPQFLPVEAALTENPNGSGLVVLQVGAVRG